VAAIEVCRLRHGQLHLCRELVAADARGQNVVGARTTMAFVHGREQLPRRQFLLRGERARRSKIVNRRALSAENNALMPGRQEAVAPVDRAAGRQAARVGNDHE